MARTVKPEKVAAKRREILDATQRLVFTKGYDQTSIQDILDEANISSGAFHHYFSSRGALLEAFIERIKQGLEQPLLPLLHDPHLTAIEKLQGFFDTLERLRIDHRGDVVKLARVWYTDHNAIIRQKVEHAVREQRLPLLAEIVRQGLREGVFTTAYPDQAGEIILSLLQGMGDTDFKLLFSLEQDRDEERCIQDIVLSHAAYMDAVERVLGASPNSLSRTGAEAVRLWVAAVKETTKHRRG